MDDEGPGNAMLPWKKTTTRPTFAVLPSVSSSLEHHEDIRMLAAQYSGKRRSLVVQVAALISILGVLRQSAIQVRRHRAFHKVSVMPLRFKLLILALYCGACSSTYKASNADLWQACNSGDEAACSAYTAAVTECERHPSASRSLLRESWATNNCEGHE
jgi:hypothetical protein